MSAKLERRGLGRGLSALMAEINLDEAAESAPRESLRMLPIESVVPNPDQPRRRYGAEELAELADSIRVRGVLQPLIVRHQPDSGLYQIVAGERRWRAAQQARLHEIPAIIRDFTDTEVLEVALIENIQRADLNAVEEAAAYRQLMERFGHTQEQLAEALHKSRSHVANHLRLLTLPEQVLDWVREGTLTAGHARALITAGDPVALARRVIDRGLSVRETEALVQAREQRQAKPHRKMEKDADTRALEGDLTAQLKMRVAIDHVGTEGGRLSVTYRSLEDLDRLCHLLARNA
ncbi:ParB/RepB/Spo0J family partition protein [Paracoccus sp. S-4012]|uniref:ParB/RepB/Spo0J family partition protein n=1 Tax=Paracoccus sp. S-4012 TaxID=2665648 RepID=UPI0012B081A6|nr:ParB/RepB/Spo0J family partition protein [Paracoccus sp. S-4012]MRX49863.1 ParB/RepB/Spo0J family partition protein [Paracoccus sp. S-4012]